MRDNTLAAIAICFLLTLFVGALTWARQLNTEEQHLKAQSAAYRTCRSVTDTAHKLAEDGKQ